MNKQLQQFKKQIENGQLAQSFLISGPEKTGKFTTVIEMVAELNSLKEEQINLARKGELVDIILIETEVSKRQIMINEEENNLSRATLQTDSVNLPRSRKLKDKITKKQIDIAMKDIQLKNFQLNKKIIIVKDANKMTVTAANSLLKLIEEPSSNLVIFLLVNNEDDVLPTIKSRCQVIRFSFINEEEINKIIKKKYSLDTKTIKEILTLAGGRMELARQYANNPRLIKMAQKNRDDFRKALKEGKIAQIKLVDKLIGNEIELLWAINEWVWYLKFFLEEAISNKQSIAIIKKVHFILNSLLKTREIIKTTNVNKKIQLENFFIQI